MAKTLSFDIDNFNAGLVLLQDDSTAPIGSAREMTNVFITDRGGIAPRPGTMMLGTRNPSSDVGNGFFVFKKSFGFKEIPIKAYGTTLEGYYDTLGEWFTVKNGFTINQRFGFVSSLVNTENDDFVYFCNRYEPYQRWSGQIATITSALVGGETSIPVDSTLEEDIFFAGVATDEDGPAPTATKIHVQHDPLPAPWVDSQWVNFYVYITSGTYAGEVRKITANNTHEITFDTLPGAPAVGDTFEIRMVKFNLTLGSVFTYNGTQITVTAVNTATSLTVASAHAAPINTPVTQSPIEFLDAPRGNRMDALLGRVLVGNVRSALSYDSGGALQGSNSAGSVWVSRINNPSDFTYDATRIAGQGDLISTPYGGGNITAIAVQENVAYIYKERYVEAIRYSGDIDDYAVRNPLKPGAGSAGRVIKGKDDHYFMSADKEFTSLGRVENKDITIQSANIGLPIKRLLDAYNFDDFNGVEFQNRILFSAKSNDLVTQNNSTIVWNQKTRSFEGAWNIGAIKFDTYKGGLYYMEASGPNVWQMFEERKTDVDNDIELPISATWQSNFFNLVPIKGNFQAINSIAFEGYIAANTIFTFNLYKDFETSPVLSFPFGGPTDEEFLTGSNLASFLGANPLGLEPIGTIDTPGADGRRRFSFLVYFPYIYGQYFSMGYESSGIDQDWEIIRSSLGLREMVSTIRPGIKQI
jgi:hypothetical protein